ncbi:flavin reductase family protein [Dysosmobacter sp.]|jgi:flavin reductase (DIM6/NTAB) family NADH-FMN oxidoreductase RutF|uniref:flavin reductase family protein n=1 Tax=Dysosmobacter sp. TaxID=2591382 RepID=UPI002DB7E48B|nr:flavin reductase family protein [uncultured Oscillibacter sp.]
MKELNIMEATVFTSPNPLTLICSQNKDGTTNLAPICFVTYLSFNPPMIAFAAGRQSHTGKRVRETGKVIVTVPGESLARAVMACGSTTGATANKVAENHIEMTAVEGSDIQIPADTRLAMVATLQQSVEVGDHILHICRVDKFLGDENKKGLCAWNGFGKVAPAVEG